MLVTCVGLSVAYSSLLSYPIPQKIAALPYWAFQRAALCTHVEEAEELFGFVWQALLLQCMLPFLEVCLEVTVL